MLCFKGLVLALLKLSFYLSLKSIVLALFFLSIVLPFFVVCFSLKA